MVMQTPNTINEELFFSLPCLPVNLVGNCRFSLVLIDCLLLVFQAMKEDIVHQIESSFQDTDTDSPFALVVDGRALEIALKPDEKDQSFISF